MGDFKDALKLNEVIIPIISGFIISIGLFYLINQYANISSIFDNYPAFLSLSAAFIGFLVTAFTILIAFPEQGRIKDLKKFNLYPQLYYFFIISILSQVLVLIVALIGLLFKITGPAYSFLMIFVIILSVMFLILVIWVLKRMTDLYFTK